MNHSTINIKPTFSQLMILQGDQTSFGTFNIISACFYVDFFGAKIQTNVMLDFLKEFSNFVMGSLELVCLLFSNRN